MHLQQTRHQNLLQLLRLMEEEGIFSVEAQAKRIGGFDANALARMKAQRPIGCLVARRIEWAMSKPNGWMDQRHDTTETA
ncbi:hypothetical protein FHW69_003196 [Luteibacter sp. Sphag1AF]|uniref:hypothetical protein n=1 Tax=Luteibacter sp. Sphag1AF TaxID=2587031 RepID=UPI00160B38FD|nr:hypothetical protein [Luteibacter sp. Sphag1AF]MBB3228554.1 hypothetical protein [Luteibacter sp. Sphag1AF]